MMTGLLQNAAVCWLPSFNIRNLFFFGKYIKAKRKEILPPTKFAIKYDKSFLSEMFYKTLEKGISNSCIA